VGALAERGSTLPGRLLIDGPSVSLLPIMSAAASSSTSHSNFVSIFNAALEAYKRKTKKDLATHPLLLSLQSCDSPEAILTVLREQIPAFIQSQNGDDSLTKWVAPTVNVLYAFSATLGGGVGLVSSYFLVKNFCSNIASQVFPPANAIFAGIGILLFVSVLHCSLA
jgi:hypothetical protein